MRLIFTQRCKDAKKAEKPELRDAPGVEMVIGQRGEFEVRMRNFEAQGVGWLEPWFAVGEGSALEAELSREVRTGHPLHRLTVRAVGRRADNDDVLYFLPGHEPPFAVVHLTWAGESSPGWPSTVFYSSLGDWIERRMKPDHLDAG